MTPLSRSLSVKQFMWLPDLDNTSTRAFETSGGTNPTTHHHTPL